MKIWLSCVGGRHRHLPAFDLECLCYLFLSIQMAYRIKKMMYFDLAFVRFRVPLRLRVKFQNKVKGY